MGYEKIQQFEIPQLGSDRSLIQMGLSGVRYDVPTRALNLDDATDLLDVHLKYGDLVKDWGYTEQAAASAIANSELIGLTDFGYITSLEYRPIRILRVGAGPTYELNLEVGTDYSDSTITSAGAEAEASLLEASAVSILSNLIIANGGSPQIWDGAAAAMSYLSADTTLTAQVLALFGDRIIALYADGDPQKIRWNASGDLSTGGWTASGSGESFLVEVGNSDSIDAILTGLQVSQDTFAVFRQNSIWRLFKTGNSTLAIGSRPWLGVGAYSRRAVAKAGNFVAFLGNDKIIYLLDGAGNTVPIGMPLAKQTEQITGKVEMVYDHHAKEILLADKDNDITWVFNCDEYINRQKLVWTKREFGLDAESLFHCPNHAPLVGSNIEGILFSVAGAVYRTLSSATAKDGVAFTGYWRSRPLNRTNLATITMLQLFYTCPSATTITVKTTTDGGATFNESKTVDLAATGDKQAVVNIGFNTTGEDLRFQIDLDTTVACKIHGFLPIIVERGNYEYRTS